MYNISNLVTLGFFLFGIVGIFWSFQFPLKVVGFPLAVLILISVFSLIELIKSYTKSGIGSKPSIKTIISNMKSKSFLMPLYMVAITLITVFLIKKIGFFVSISIFLIVTMLMLGAKPSRTLLVTASLVLIIWLLFAKFLNVPFPHGQWLSFMG